MWNYLKEALFLRFETSYIKNNNTPRILEGRRSGMISKKKE